jgi:hypothetical protein
VVLIDNQDGLDQLWKFEDGFTVARTENYSVLIDPQGRRIGKFNNKDIYARAGGANEPHLIATDEGVDFPNQVGFDSQTLAEWEAAIS